METQDDASLFALVPDWWLETMAGLAAATLGVAGIVLGSYAVVAVRGALFGPGYGAGLDSATAVLRFVVSFVLLAVVHWGVCLGVARAYLAARSLEPGFVFEWPSREAGTWLVGIAVLVPVLLAAGTAVGRVADVTNGLLAARIPYAFVFGWSGGAFPYLRAAPAPVSLGMDGLLRIVAVGPPVAVLFHGTVQPSVRRVASGRVASLATALALGAANLGAVPLMVADKSAPTRAGLAGVLVVMAVAFVAGIAYERTDNLAVPTVAYGALNAGTVLVGVVAFVVG